MVFDPFPHILQPKAVFDYLPSFWSLKQVVMFQNHMVPKFLLFHMIAMNTTINQYPPRVGMRGNFPPQKGTEARSAVLQMSRPIFDNGDGDE